MQIGDVWKDLNGDEYEVVEIKENENGLEEVSVKLN